MPRRLTATIVLVASLVLATIGSAAADITAQITVDDDDVLPNPALPIGPGPL
jgi:hypothetical protein